MKVPTKVFIIPGLYIPFNWEELNLVLQITKVSMDPETYENFKFLKDEASKFEELGLDFITKLIHDVKKTSPEFIRGFHFFTMNSFKMVQKLIKTIGFSEV